MFFCRLNILEFKSKSLYLHNDIKSNNLQDESATEILCAFLATHM